MWIILLFFSGLSWAFPILHFIKPESNFTQITTLDACSTYRNARDIVGCNPALFPLQKDEGLRMSVATITDGESVEVGQKLLFDPIKEEFLKEIFEKRSFNSWGGNTNIELRTSAFFLGYDPLSVNADVKVFNPSSPEVAMSLIKSNRLHITSGFLLQNSKSWKASLGAKVYYYRSQYYQDSFFLSDLVGQDIDQLIKLKDKSGIAGDIGAYFEFNNPYLPKIAFLVKNLGTNFSNSDSDINSENQMRPILVYETYSRLSLGYDIKTHFGSFNMEVSAPFQKIYENLYSEYISGSFGYALSRFSVQAAISKYQQILGFDFCSKIASIGIFYGKNQPLGDFSTQKESVGGVRAGISL